VREILADGARDGAGNNRGIVELSFLGLSRKLRIAGGSELGNAELPPTRGRKIASHRRARCRLITRALNYFGIAFSRRRGHVLAFYPRKSQKECSPRASASTLSLANSSISPAAFPMRDLSFPVHSYFQDRSFASLVYISPRYHISRSRHVARRTLRSNSLTLAGKRVFVSSAYNAYSSALIALRASFERCLP